MSCSSYPIRVLSTEFGGSACVRHPRRDPLSCQLGSSYTDFAGDPFGLNIGSGDPLGVVGADEVAYNELTRCVLICGQPGVRGDFAVFTLILHASYCVSATFVPTWSHLSSVFSLSSLRWMSARMFRPCKCICAVWARSTVTWTGMLAHAPGLMLS